MSLFCYFVKAVRLFYPLVGTAFGRKLVEIILRRSPEKVKVVAQRTYPGNNPQIHGAFTVFLYTKGKKEIPSVELKQFLTYFEQTTEGNACNKDLTELHEMVSRVRMDEEVELEFMKIFEREEMINAASIAPLYNLIQENPDKSVEDFLSLPCISNSLTLDHKS